MRCALIVQLKLVRKSARRHPVSWLISANYRGLLKKMLSDDQEIGKRLDQMRLETDLIQKASAKCFISSTTFEAWHLVERLGILALEALYHYRSLWSSCPQPDFSYWLRTLLIVQGPIAQEGPIQQKRLVEKKR